MACYALWYTYWAMPAFLLLIWDQRRSDITKEDLFGMAIASMIFGGLISGVIMITYIIDYVSHFKMFKNPEDVIIRKWK